MISSLKIHDEMSDYVRFKAERTNSLVELVETHRKKQQQQQQSAKTFFTLFNSGTSASAVPVKGQLN